VVLGGSADEAEEEDGGGEEEEAAELAATLVVSLLGEFAGSTVLRHGVIVWVKVLGVGDGLAGRSFSGQSGTGQGKYKGTTRGQE